MIKSVMPSKKPRYEVWDAKRIRALRRYLGYTQQRLSEELGTRQQTVSEWETGMYRPRGASAKLLSLIAERAAFRYDEQDGGEARGEHGRPDRRHEPHAQAQHEPHAHEGQGSRDGSTAEGGRRGH
jgi:transcriptional regulator with XRE-family HTH domain